MMAIGIWSEMPIDGIFVIAFAYVISRSLYGISVLTMKHAQCGKCSMYVPDNNIIKYLQILINIGYLLICAVLMVSIAKSFDMPRVAIACFIGAALSYVYYIIILKKHFGGVTEEAGGFFITVCEVVIPLAALLAFKSPI